MEAVAISISREKVTYLDTKGSEKYIQANKMVIYASLKPKKDEALKFYSSANRFFIIGYCSDEGRNVQKSILSTFFAVSQI